MSSSAAGASASEGDVWDSGWVDGAGSVAVPYGGAPLEPSKVYYWKVKVKTDTGGESEWSAAKSFMTAGSLEEYVQTAVEDSRPGDDVAGGGLIVALLVKQLYGSIHDMLAGKLLLFLHGQLCFGHQ